MQSRGGDTLMNKDQFVMGVTLEEKVHMDQIVNKFVDKFFKIYKKINVKVESKEILKQELDYKKPLLGIFDSISGHLNKVTNQITQFMKETDNEVHQYKNIIQNKLRPQIQKLLDENELFKTKGASIEPENPESLVDTTMAMDIQNQVKLENEQKIQRLRSKIGELRGENTFF